MQFICNDFEGVTGSDSFEINLDLFRTFRDPLLLKQITGREHTTSFVLGCPTLKFHKCVCYAVGWSIT